MSALCLAEDSVKHCVGAVSLYVINKFIEAEKIDSFELLPTAAELKKQPVKHRLY